MIKKQPRSKDQHPNGATLLWRDLSVYAMDRNRKTISKQLINNVRGVVKPGNLTAILGGSGSGKTSLMTALAFRTGPGIVVHGDIRVNGAPVGSSYMKHHSGFMHQEDIFIGTMTILEHLWFMARMKLDRRVRNREIREKIENVLRDVGLTRRCNVRIGDNGEGKILSGGEKKRLAFATELLTDPKILFLDEPTTGQDAHSASVLVSELMSFAAKGRSVLCTIHQPSSAIFNCFHRIILVADGRIAFAGTSEQAIQFFASQGYECPQTYNPADFLVATLAIAPKHEDSSRRAAQRICDAFLTSEACKEMDVTMQLELHIAETYYWRNNAFCTNDFKQLQCWLKLFWLVRRGFLQVLRDPSLQLIRMLQKLCVATMAGLCFVGAVNLDQLGIQAVQGVIFILVSENAFFPMYATLSLIPQELPLFIREYRAGMYSVYLYYIARILSLIPGLIIEPIIFTAIVYWLSGLRATTDAIGLTMIVIIFTMNVSTACGCFFSAAFDSVPLAMAYLVPFDYILMISMGPFVKLSTLPIYVRWVRYISWLLHSTEALSIIQWRGVQNISCEIVNKDLPCITDGSEVLEHYDFNENNFWLNIISMTVIYIAFHLFGVAGCVKNGRRCLNTRLIFLVFNAGRGNEYRTPIVPPDANEKSKETDRGAREAHYALYQRDKLARGGGAMADDRKNAQRLIGQVHAVRHTSPPPPAPTSVVARKESSPLRGPRTLLLRRSENGFGFTLRHFIVYPPESCCMLPGHERTRIDEPMDTIFVKQVRANSPAAEAGLRTGDRVVSVDGIPTRGEQYASVVQRIQQAGPWLRLLVVSKEDDILQRYFGETAHNPETNQRPRLRSPERISQKQRRSISMIPGPSPRTTRQSWICSLPDSENQSTNSACRESEEVLYKEQQQANKMSPSIPVIAAQQRRFLQEGGVPCEPVDDRMQARKLQQQQQAREVMESPPQPYSRPSPDQRFDLYDRTRPESIYSRPSSEQIYDRIKDPIYERVRSGESGQFEKEQQQQLTMLRYPMSRAEPQVPIYRPGRRVIARRASEGSGGTGQTNESEVPSYGSIDALRSNDPSSRLSMDSRRDSSPVSKGSLSSFDSNSTVTGNECSDDSVIMNRLRKSFEQKEEFLRRPSHPIGWCVTEDVSRLQQQQGATNSSVIQREFYARPQKLQRQIWPPNEQQQRQQSPTRRVENKNSGKLALTKPSNQNVQRVKTDLDSESEYSNTRSDQSDDRSNLSDGQRSIRDRFYSSLYESQLGKENHFVYPTTKSNDQDRYKNASKSMFVSTLSKIHENSSNLATNQQQQQQLQDPRSESLSVPSSPGPDKKNNDKFLVPPQGLQIVSRRAKQFESGRLLSDDEEPTSDRTNLYKSELSRLSNKRSVPNVAVRKREFESKAESQEPRRIPANRESKSLDAEIPAMETEAVHLRARSNSAESWEAVNGSRGNARHTWQTDQEDFEEKDNKNDNNNGDNKSQSYAQSTRTQLAEGTPNNGVILRRQKNAQLSDEERATRRVSYLKATWGERMHVDSDLDLSDSEPVHVLRSAHRRWRPPLFTSDITPLRRIFEDMTQSANLHRHSLRNSIVSTTDSGNETPKEVEPVEREGTLHIKFTVLDGKRSSDRSWKQIWGVLRGPILFFYKDRHSQSPSSVNDTEGTVQNIDVRCSLVDVAEDYTKRKHVLRVANPTAEVLLQTEDAASMALWLRALHKYAATEKPLDAASSTSKQQAVPQTPGPTTPSVASVQNANQRLSPLPSHKGIKKLTSFRNRSPTGQSPVNKTRKPSQTIEPLPSPKTKTWKGRVAKQFRRMHGQAGSPSSPTAQLPPEGATFKVPLELCPSSSFSEFVPLLVEMCTSIVEARGLEVVGIYRVPGNTAAISQLTESVNKGFENINLQDPRWSDVNVISSLLKSFFRQLPDSLLTAELYPMFIDADKIEDPQRRMATIRKLLRDLPEHHFETLKYLMLHLKKIVEHSEVNKMEAKNLAIVFGPTLVRASGSRDNMVTMVTDMSHQCRIVESLLNNVDWFFSEEDLDDLSRLSVNLSLPADGCEVEPTSNTNHNLLLNNIQKVEANRKIQRRRKGQDDTENEEHDEEKGKVKHESENSPTIRQSMALNERQCSVSEIVLMHENKSHLNHSNNSTEPLDRSATNNSSPVSVSSSSRSKYSNQLVPAVSSSSESSRPLSEAGLSCVDTNSMTSNASNETKQSNDEVAIRTYAGLSATTQERIRRFEQETKAMLQRDQHRQRREAEKREEERRRIEREWQLAKREMENDDLLDTIVDSTVTPTFLSERLSNLNQRLAEKSLADLSEKHVRSRSTTRITPLSIAVQQQPTARQKAQATNQLSNVLGEKINNGVIKKFKTDKEPSLESICLPPIRYGSLDSLHEVHTLPHSSPSPSQQRRGISGDISDDGIQQVRVFGATYRPTYTVPQGPVAPPRRHRPHHRLARQHQQQTSTEVPRVSGSGPGAPTKTLNRFLRGSDLLTSLTTTFDRKWRSLVNPSSQIIQTPVESPVVDSNEVSDDQKQKVEDLSEKSQPTEKVYRDPSLHKSSIDKNHFLRTKDEALEKDTDSTVTEVHDTNAMTTPDNDRNANNVKKLETQNVLNHIKENNVITDNAAKKEEDKKKEEADVAYVTTTKEGGGGSSTFRKSSEAENKPEERKVHDRELDSNYSNKLEKFEILTNTEERSRLKRSESLNKRSENTFSKLKRSESLNKHSERLASPTNSKLKRSESLNKHSDRSESPNSKLKRSESLTKTEKTECNISKRRQSVRKDSATKLKRKNGMPERSIKRRHTVGGTKDFDKVHWLDNKLQSEAERVIKNDYKPKKSQLRTSSPDLSTNRVNVADTSFLIEVSFRGPSNVVFNVTNARPQSLPDANLASKVFKVPLESHV
ncbi:hypothetical protein KPH14_006668 [Odynerus spinipes]|uniref:Uncharacterized protein n=1 Tax=Odynerus spinipes TaxID=1348599 RepID=A0AAD9RQV3_9HYME|nr:hypothetical protein KPH14_006668 [Odynerus spinipes]